MSVERAKSMLPLIPDEVFETFLNALIEEGLGWPFNTVDDSLSGTRWLGVFDPLTLKKFSNLTWALTTVEMAPNRIYSRSWQDILLTSKNYASHFTLLDTTTSLLLKQKFSRQLEYIRVHGEITSPIVITITPDGKIAIFDGIHRIAASFLLSRAEPIIVRAWLGSTT